MSVTIDDVLRIILEQGSSPTEKGALIYSAHTNPHLWQGLPPDQPELIVATLTYQLSVAGTACVGAHPCPADHTSDIMEALFAPFAKETFPKRLNQAQLSQLLSTEPAVKVPVQPDYLKDLNAELFEADSSKRAPELVSRLNTALLTRWPKGIPSEALYNAYWDNVGFSLPEFVGKEVGVPAVCCRGVVDSSITRGDRTRDYMLLLGGVLLIGAEDEPHRHLMGRAVAELLKKHKGANASLYGELGYMVLVATAGEWCAVFAKEFGDDKFLETLIPAFAVSNLEGRKRMLRLFINLTRWVRTVDVMKLLPPPPPSPLAVPFTRSTPYPGIESDVHLTLHNRYVEKKFEVPHEHLTQLLDVYKTLQDLNLPSTIQCTSMKINGEPAQAFKKSTLRDRIDHFVELILEPVGACVIIMTDSQLHSLVTSLLHILESVHGAGLVHRDIRVANVVKYHDQWVLIDWELAGAPNEKVWWNGRVLPEPVQAQVENYTVQTNFWQLGQLIMAESVASRAARDSAQHLIAGHFPTALNARHNIWAVA